VLVERDEFAVELGRAPAVVVERRERTRAHARGRGSIGAYATPRDDDGDAA
jgi:hypothetical protein